ncbi:hypothetical protein [Pedobacter sp. SYSU D00535]|uniref:hypothetical protein n=1 Tax=Pedobacter sp. SYSU D00535 TaxID=2810308 RepID=UPI001A977F6D|nr:hypothetical protein [Pedobacter sp. SYSU D00535]
MNRLLTIIILVLTFNNVLYGQTHFCDAKKINYKKIALTIGQDEKDSTFTAKLHLPAFNGIEDLQVTFTERKSSESSVINVYRNGKLAKSRELSIRMWTMDDRVKMADIDGNGLHDLKFLVYNFGSGLAGSQSTKVYLFTFKDEMKIVSFFDFAYEDEYDIDSDGEFEILSLNHKFRNNHSYWVYNAYNLTGTALRNVSKKFKYPLWTRHLYRTDRVIAKDITYLERLKEYREQPDECVVE